MQVVQLFAALWITSASMIFGTSLGIGLLASGAFIAAGGALWGVLYKRVVKDAKHGFETRRLLAGSNGRAAVHTSSPTCDIDHNRPNDSQPDGRLANPERPAKKRAAPRRPESGPRR